MSKEKKKNEWVEWGKAILIAILLAFLLRSFVFATSVVDGESMVPTLEDGETVLFNKFMYLFDEPERGDIVIIERPLKNYVKRIIALPGETVKVVNDTLYIDGKEYEQNFISENARSSTGIIGPIEVPKNQYFVMGDNRAISKDSRNGLGMIRAENIVGEAEVVIFPFSEWNVLE
ncbi:signal peptidase I [Virgibacillus kekensis]|uniref:Signal peptidase I n=1 Tax=Virgibacillus kekensis TaxID=202261 RepID=A0ABV9DF93_9BACI